MKYSNQPTITIPSKSNFLKTFEFYFLFDRLIKSLQFSLLCRMNHSEAIAKATELFKSIPPGYFNNEEVDIT